LFGVAALLVSITLKGKPTNQINSLRSDFVENYDNTGIFSCGTTNFAANVPWARLYYKHGLDEFGVQHFEWHTPFDVSTNTWAAIFCKSINDYPAWLDKVSSTYGELPILSNVDLGELQTQGFSLLNNHTTLAFPYIYNYDLVLVNETFTNPEESAKFIFMKSKQVLSEDKKQLNQVILALYGYSNDEKMLNYFNSMFDTLKFVK